jgi:hypothetical protein
MKLKNDIICLNLNLEIELIYLINNSIFKRYSENKYQIDLVIIILFLDYVFIAFACECMVENMPSVLSK